MSHHQRRIIVQFMAANCGRSTTREAAPADEAEEVKEEELDCGRNMSVDRIHALLDDMAKHKQKQDSDKDRCNVSMMWSKFSQFLLSDRSLLHNHKKAILKLEI